MDEKPLRLTPDFERTLTRYLLGQLEEGLRLELEELLITDADAFEALGVIEDELIDGYLDGTGSPAERRGIEEHFLSSPRGRRRLRFAQALRRRASVTRARPDPVTRLAGFGRVWSPAWRPAWAALAAILVVSLAGNAWFLARAPEPEVESPRAEGRAERPAPVSLPTAASPPSLAMAPPPPSAPPMAAAAERRILGPEARRESTKPAERGAKAPAPVATVALAAGMLRAQGALPRVSVPKDAVVVRLRLELPGDDYPLYRAALVDAEGDEIWAASKLRVDGGPEEPAVIIELPAGILARGDYQLKLSGTREGQEPEAVETYAFRVSPP